jgi:hypothetical protein
LGYFIAAQVPPPTGHTNNAFVVALLLMLEYRLPAVLELQVPVAATDPAAQVAALGLVVNRE